MAQKAGSNGLAKTPKAEKKAKTGRGHFFAIEQNTWELICENLSFNAAVAFLVLACGSGRDNTTTCWSAKAVSVHTGMSWPRAKEAIHELRINSFVEVVKAGTKPQYKLRNQKKSKQKSSSVERIWLPNALIMGARNELPPLARIRATQDIQLLRLLIDLYRAHDLMDEGGVRRNVLFRPHERTEIGRRAQYVLYGFNALGERAYLGCDILKAHKGDEAAKEAFWERLQALVSYQLVEWVTYLCETDAQGGGELMHPCTYVPSEKEPLTIDKQIGAAAHEAGEAMLAAMVEDGHGGAEVRAQVTWQLVPIRQQFRHATLIDVALLKYRPRTTKTSMWRANLQRQGEVHIQEFRRVLEKFRPQPPARKVANGSWEEELI